MRAGGVVFQPIARAFRRSRVPQARILGLSSAIAIAAVRWALIPATHPADLTIVRPAVAIKLTLIHWHLGDPRESLSTVRVAAVSGEAQARPSKGGRSEYKP